MMEKRLKFARLLSLEEMALRRLAINLWSGSDVLTAIYKLIWGKTGNLCTRDGWIDWFKNMVQEKVLKLELPESLRKQMNDIILPIGVQIFKWEKYGDCTGYHDYLFCDCPDYTNCDPILSTHRWLSSLLKLCWTTPATIDSRKTAEELVRWEELRVGHRYEIACIHCLEDYIPPLWEKLGEEGREYFYNRKTRSCRPELKFCWPHIMKGELSNLDDIWRESDRNLTSFNQYVFECSVNEGNKTAAEYFFQKLTPEERDASLMRTAHAVIRKRPDIRFEDERALDIFCYLLSLMTPDQQMEISMAGPFDVLACFLVWPRQDLFLENARLILTFLPSSCYGQLLYKMSAVLVTPCYYFPKLFLEFLRQSPLDLKRAFIDDHHAQRSLKAFLKFDDSDSIKSLFRNLDVADRGKIIVRSGVLEIFYEKLIEGPGKWPLVELCLQEAALSKQDRERLKHLGRPRPPSSKNGNVWHLKRPSECGNPDLKRFYDFIDEADASADTEKKALKRKLESGSPEQ